MQTHTPYPTAGCSPGFLNISKTLQIETDGIRSISYVNIPTLSFLLLADRLAELYEIVFPDHLEWLDEETVDWENEEAVAAAVERFLGHVGNLFPVYDDIWDVDLDVIEWRLYEIPVMLMGFDEWYDGWDDLKEPAPYLLDIRYSRYDEDGSYRRNEFADLYPDYQVPRALEPHRLVNTLRIMTLPEPLNALPDLILMLDHSTGNSWLDVGECALAEGGGYPLWNREDVEWLGQEWQKARPILDGVMDLLNWKNDSPDGIAEKLTAVRDLLLEAYERMQQ
jgi:hypothetical protein